jgi:hypothetical protein
MTLSHREASFLTLISFLEKPDEISTGYSQALSH